MFEFEVDAIFLGAEAASTNDGGTIRSVLLANGAETMKVYVGEAGLEAFGEAEKLPAATHVRVRLTLRQEGYKNKVNLLSIQPKAVKAA